MMRGYSMEYMTDSGSCDLCRVRAVQVVENMAGSDIPPRRYCLECVQDAIFPAIMEAVTPRVYDVVVLKSCTMSSVQMAALIGAKGVVIGRKDKRSIVDFVGHTDAKLADSSDLKILYRPRAQQIREREHEARSFLMSLRQQD